MRNELLGDEASSISRLHILLDALGAATRAVLAAADREALLTGVCAALIPTGGFSMVLVGADEDRDGWFEMLASAGAPPGLLDGLRVSTTDGPEGGGPTGIAVRTGEPVVCDDLSTDPRLAPWRDRLRLLGYGSSAAFPIRARSVPDAVITIYARESRAFDAEAIAILAQLADTVGLGLDALAERAAATAAEDALRASDARYAELVERVPVGVYMYRNRADGAFAFDFLSPQAGRILGVDAEAAVADPRAGLASIHPDDLPAMFESSQRALAANETFRWEGRCVVGGEVRVVRIDGTPTRQVEGWTRWYGIVEDVTERQAAEAALAESEARFRLVAENASDVVFRASNEGIVEWISPSVASVVGWRPDELVGRPSRSFTHPDDVATLAAAQADVLNGASRRCEIRVRTADGRYRWMDVVLRPIVDEDGAVTARVGSWRDVTGQHAAQEELRASEEKYRYLVEELDAVISVVDESTGTTWVSPQVTAMFGYGPEEMGQPGFWRSLVADEDLERVLAVWDDDGTRGPYELEYRMRRADDTVIWIRERMRPVEEPDGRAVRWLGVALDVTERHRLEDVERARLAAEQRLGHVTRLARDIILLLDEDARIVDANEAAVETYGYPRERLLTMRAVELRAPETAPDFWATFETAAGPAGMLFETVHRRADGSTFPVEVSVHAVEIDGVPHRLSILRDVTELRRARDAYARSERFEALALLAAGVAHDFKNILWGIDLIASGMRSPSPTAESVARDAGLIGDAVGHGTTLVGQLLDFARPRTPGREPVEVGGLVEAIAPILERLVGSVCRVQVAVAPGDRFVRIDRAALEQVLINLVVNARDAMPDGGTVTIRAETVELAAGRTSADLPPGPYAEIAVTDTGRGMEAAILERIFLPYFTTKGAKGTGLGLATSLGIVRGAEGTIEVESEPGHGTTFRVLLPIVPTGATRRRGDRPRS